MKHQRLLHAIALAFAISFLLPSKVCCQQLGSSPFRKYVTQSYNAGLLATNPLFRENLQNLEDSINNFLLFGNITSKTIPVVFHILQSPGMPLITDSTIIRQLNQLNFDYNNAPISSVVALESIVQAYGSRAFIPQIYFCLTDSIGDIPILENIIRTNVSPINFPVSNDMKSRDSDGSDPILPKNCLNIWICNLPDSIAGFSQMPGGPLASDGVVISYKYLIPSISTLKSLDYNKGKTLSHLVGSYLGVYELWNEENPCYDDYVYDTPLHNEPNHGFEIFDVHSSTCPGIEIEMIINHMDNAFDSMAVMFTKGQVSRMHSVLSSSLFRESLCSNIIQCNDSIGTGDIISDPNISRSKDLFKVYPNPANNSIKVDINLTEQSAVSFILYDISGKVLIQEKWVELSSIFSKVIDVSNVYPGLYYIYLNSANENKVYPITILK